MGRSDMSTLEQVLLARLKEAVFVGARTALKPMSDTQTAQTKPETKRASALPTAAMPPKYGMRLWIRQTCVSGLHTKGQCLGHGFCH